MLIHFTRAGIKFRKNQPIISDRPISSFFEQGVYNIHLSGGSVYLNNFHINFTNKETGLKIQSEQNKRVLGYPKWVRTKNALLVFIPKGGVYTIEFVYHESLKVYAGVAVGLLFVIPIYRMQQANVYFEPDWK